MEASENGAKLKAPKCSLCGRPCEPWPHSEGTEPSGWGNNPAPLGSVNERCCDTCNMGKVIPARLSALMGDTEKGID